VVEELERRGWVTKRWVTRKGGACGGRLFTKTSLYRLLSNVTYAGKIKYKNEVHPGEQTCIVEPAVWKEVQALLQRNGRDSREPVRSRVGALLQGLLRSVSVLHRRQGTGHSRGVGRVRPDASAGEQFLDGTDSRRVTLAVTPLVCSRIPTPVP
jgi:site-specific DNA recombinase